MEHEFKIEKSVRYFTHGNAETAKKIWIVLHGYGQLPYYFIRKFESLDPEENFVIAPEGMHRFYLEGTSGRVGASWMTKESRLDDIEDNINYLDSLATELMNNKNFEKKILLGFSQGGATATRWHESGNFKADIFVLWASVFPPDLDFDPNQSSLMKSQNLFLLGKNDPYFKGKEKDVKKLFKSQKFNFEIIDFDGNHDIVKEPLLKISNNI
jgi:predicted esterase